MRGFLLLAAAAAGGFAGGVLLNHIVAVIGLWLYEGELGLVHGLRYVPVITSILCTVVYAVWHPQRCKKR